MLPQPPGRQRISGVVILLSYSGLKLVSSEGESPRSHTQSGRMAFLFPEFMGNSSLHPSEYLL